MQPPCTAVVELGYPSDVGSLTGCNMNDPVYIDAEWIDVTDPCFFGEAFDIPSGGSVACSGCVAFGLERWVAALLDQLGPDESRWP